MLAVNATQFDLVHNVLSLTVAAMGAAAVFFFLQRSEVVPKYRIVVTLAGIVPMIACYNYYWLLNSWDSSFINVNGVIKATSHVYNEAYRYSDWLLTVPILLINLVLVIDLPKRQAQARCFVLGLMAAQMILLGYPGLTATDPATRWLWWGASMVPFGIILFQLYVSLAEAVRLQPEGVRHLVVAARFLTVVVWCTYPIIYLLPMFGLNGTSTFIVTQIAYAVADITAKAMFGILIFMIALRKSYPEGATQAAGTARMRQAA